MSSAFETKEREFAFQICRALDENAARLSGSAAERLALARRLALTRKKREPAHAFAPVLAPAGHEPAWQPQAGERPVKPLRRLARAWPVVALVLGITVIAYWENLQRAAELADIDAAMLNDDLPLNAYLDHGFNAYLSHAR